MSDGLPGLGTESKLLLPPSKANLRFLALGEERLADSLAVSAMSSESESSNSVLDHCLGNPTLLFRSALAGARRARPWLARVAQLFCCASGGFATSRVGGDSESSAK